MGSTIKEKRSDGDLFRMTALKVGSNLERKIEDRALLK